METCKYKLKHYANPQRGVNPIAKTLAKQARMPTDKRAGRLKAYANPQPGTAKKRGA